MPGAGGHGNGKVMNWEKAEGTGKVVKGVYSSLDLGEGGKAQGTIHSTKRMWKGGRDCYRRESRVMKHSGATQVRDRTLAWAPSLEEGAGPWLSYKRRLGVSSVTI